MSSNPNTNQTRKTIPIYDSRGNARAFLVYPYIHNTSGEWIGWVTANKEVYSVLGIYVGFLTDEPRILRKRVTSSLKPRLRPPTAPVSINIPAIVPLAPMMRELTFSTIDVLLDDPKRLHTTDSGEQRLDLE